MRLAPARPAHACFMRTCCTAVVKGHDLHTSTLQCIAKQQFVFPRSHVTLHTPDFTLHASYFISSHLISSLRHHVFFSQPFIAFCLSNAQTFSSHRSSRLNQRQRKQRLQLKTASRRQIERRTILHTLQFFFKEIKKQKPAQKLLSQP